jgi:hypothetical protein
MRAVPSGLGSKEFGVWCIEGQSRDRKGICAIGIFWGGNSNGVLGSKTGLLTGQDTPWDWLRERAFERSVLSPQLIIWFILQDQ